MKALSNATTSAVADAERIVAIKNGKTEVSSSGELFPAEDLYRPDGPIVDYIDLTSPWVLGR